MIKSFANKITEKIYKELPLSRKEIRSLGDLNINKAQQRLEILDESSEKDLQLLPTLNYHTLHNGRYSIDAASRRSIWRITFSWENEDMINVKAVIIEDTH